MKLRGHPRCETRKKQNFNIPGSKKLRIERSEKGSVCCLTCVCVPADEFPNKVFEVKYYYSIHYVFTVDSEREFESANGGQWIS